MTFIVNVVALEDCTDGPGSYVLFIVITIFLPLTVTLKFLLEGLGKPRIHHNTAKPILFNSTYPSHGLGCVPGVLRYA